MRMIAGFETPSDGVILLDGNGRADQPTRKRDLNMLFQSYALFPPSTSTKRCVRAEVRYGKKGKNLPASFGGESLIPLSGDRFRWSGWRLHTSQAGSTLRRPASARRARPRHRVQPVGRAARRATRALDQQLRKQMQFRADQAAARGRHHLRLRHARSGRSPDDVGPHRVMNAGVVQQIRYTREIYEEPATPFVARFIGTCNLLPVNVIGDSGGSFDRLHRTVSAGSCTGRRRAGGHRSRARPCGPDGRVAAYPKGDGWLAATLVDKVYLGNQWLLRLSLGDHPLTASLTTFRRSRVRGSRCTGTRHVARTPSRLVTKIERSSRSEVTMGQFAPLQTSRSTARPSKHSHAVR